MGLVTGGSSRFFFSGKRRWVNLPDDYSALIDSIKDMHSTPFMYARNFSNNKKEVGASKCIELLVSLSLERVSTPLQ